MIPDVTAREVSGERTSPPVLRTTQRILSFRVSREELLALGWRHLLFGALCTWAAGFACWRGEPDFQMVWRSGAVASVYVLSAASILWSLLKLADAQDWVLPRVLAFVALTTLPAVLLGLLAEAWLALAPLQDAFVWAMTGALLWHAALLVLLARRLGRVGWLVAQSGWLLPAALLGIGVAVYAGAVLFQVYDLLPGSEWAVSDAVPSGLASVLHFWLAMALVMLWAMLLDSVGFAVQGAVVGACAAILLLAAVWLFNRLAKGGKPVKEAVR